MRRLTFILIIIILSSCFNEQGKTASSEKDLNSFLEEQNQVQLVLIKNLQSELNKYESYLLKNINRKHYRSRKRIIKLYKKAITLIQATSEAFNVLSDLAGSDSALYMLSQDFKWKIINKTDKESKIDFKSIENTILNSRDSILKLISCHPKKGMEGESWSINLEPLYQSDIDQINFNDVFDNSRYADTAALMQVIKKYDCLYELDQLNKLSNGEKIKCIAQIQTSILSALYSSFRVLRGQLPSHGFNFFAINNLLLFPKSNYPKKNGEIDFVLGVSDSSSYIDAFINGCHLVNMKLKYAIDTPLDKSDKIHETVSDSTGKFSIQAIEGKHKIYGKFLVDTTLDVWLPMESEFEL